VLTTSNCSLTGGYHTDAMADDEDDVMHSILHSAADDDFEDEDGEDTKS
jgi:hypothetical protein